jgi:hypothetical protein
MTHRPLRPYLVKLIRCPVFPDRPAQLPSLVCAGDTRVRERLSPRSKLLFSQGVIHDVRRDPDRGIASLIAMLELMFAYKSGYYHRLIMVHCIVQPTSWSLDSPPGFSDAAGHRSLWLRGRRTSRITRGRLGRSPFRNYTAVGTLRFLSFWDCILVTRASQVGTSYALVMAGQCIRPVVVLWAMLVRMPRHPYNASFEGEMSTCDHVASVICDCELRTLFRYWGTFPACACSRCIAWALTELHVLPTADHLSLTHGCHATYQESLLGPCQFRSWDYYAVLAEGGRTRALSGTTGIRGQ